MLEKHDFDLITRFDTPNQAEREKLFANPNERIEVWMNFKVFELNCNCFRP
jgi:hypothetical protein